MRSAKSKSRRRSSAVRNRWALLDLLTLPLLGGAVVGVAMRLDERAGRVLVIALAACLVARISILSQGPNSTESFNEFLATAILGAILTGFAALYAWAGWALAKPSRQRAGRIAGAALMILGALPVSSAMVLATLMVACSVGGQCPA